MRIARRKPRCSRDAASVPTALPRAAATAAFRLFMIVCVWLATAAAANAAVDEPLPAERLSYTLSPHPDSATLGVTLEWITVGRSRSTLAIADRWAYIDRPLRFVRDLSIEGRVVRSEREGVWDIMHEPGAMIRASYTVDPQRRSFDWDRHYEPIVWRRFFHGIGHTFLITPDPAVAQQPSRYEVAVRWNLPEGWGESLSFLTAGDDDAARVVHVDELRDGVFLAGELERRTVNVGASRVTVAMYDQFSFDVDALTEVAAQVISAETGFMNETDFPDLLVTLIPIGDPLGGAMKRRGGTGLHNSIALFLPPMAKLDAELIFLFAHELFHHWNGRVLRREAPEELVYWISEGFTDYYAWRILAEAFAEMRPTLAARLNRQIRDYHRNAAIGEGNDAIRRRFWSDPDTFGRLPYQRGMLLAIRWHHLAREQGVEDGIDRLFLELLRRARDEGYMLSNETFRAAGIEPLGPWFAGEFDRFVDGGEPVTLPPSCLQPLFAAEEVTEYPFDLGFDFDASREAGQVVGLRDGSAASLAGLREGDLLVGWSVRPGDPDHEAQLSVQRGDAQETIRFLPRGEAVSFLQFRAVQPED